MVFEHFDHPCVAVSRITQWRETWVVVLRDDIGACGNQKFGSSYEFRAGDAARNIRVITGEAPTWISPTTSKPNLS